jgi:Domain of unknown function (DUF222)
VDDQGRPARLPVSACAEVSLGLVMTQCAASWWADLAVTLRWQLRATGAALAEGRIDLSRARLIAEAAGLLGDDAARAVEGQVLPGAGALTTGQLRAALRRAVIAADPQGAERRREEAERRAKISLYGDDDGTATLSGSGLPVIQAAAAMTRITAIARALKASGATGPIDLHRARVFIGLLLGTLPYIPPAPDAPPDTPDAPPDAPPDVPPSDVPPSDVPPSDVPPSDVPPSDVPPSDVPPPADAGGPDDDGWGEDGPGDGGPDNGRQGPGPGNGGPGKGGGLGSENSGFPSRRRGGACPDAAAPGSRTRPDPADPPDDAPRPAGPPDGAPRPPDDVPWPGDQDAPCDEGDPCPDVGPGSTEYTDDEDIGDLPESAPVWAPLPSVIPPAFGRPRSAQVGTGRPPAGLLDVAVPWSVLAGLSAEPGHLGRIGPVTAPQARRLAEAAFADPAAQWRVIVTNSAGQALAVTRVLRRNKTRNGPGSDECGRPPGSGLVGRVTLTISEDALTRSQGHDSPGGIVAAVLRAAARATARVKEQAQADAAASGCAHVSQSETYRPPPRLQEFITARDLTCRFPSCRQPAWRGDLDHTIPWPQGRTCGCNLGGLCRTHHQLKQHPGWTLTQAATPGVFTWTTPAGRTYTVTPDIHPV